MLGAQPGQPSGVKHAHGEGPEPHLALLNCSCPRPENTVSPRYTSAHLHGAGVHGAGETGAQDAAHLHLHHAPTARPPFRRPPWQWIWSSYIIRAVLVLFLDAAPNRPLSLCSLCSLPPHIGCLARGSAAHTRSPHVGPLARAGGDVFGGNAKLCQSPLTPTKHFFCFSRHGIVSSPRPSNTRPRPSRPLTKWPATSSSCPSGARTR